MGQSCRIEFVPQLLSSTHCLFSRPEQTHQPKSHCSPKRPVRNSSPYWSMSRGDLARGYLLTCCFFLITRVYRRACLLDLGSKCGK
ncbi:hypothetical protein Y1Q_0000351 [Alligator mississippiensis]|uniref:Uncharacterized protein n=1 Tax=Alligator mississippiensis TaxID=8496 RepID=A0A151P105_ALLMI|nr:hypothetical protein Y1Q_0000351 [Alligator mississippiensis]